ncbi:MAG: hypothetical protein ACP5OR_06855 [Candidatus Dormibacteria bacterium]
MTGDLDALQPERLWNLASRWEYLQQGLWKHWAEHTPDGRLRYHQGRQPVLLTAPHATVHRREGMRKAADLRTGSLVELLSECTGAGFLATTTAHFFDANWDLPTTPFHDKLRELWRPGTMVIDVHGMSDTHGSDICIALGPTPSMRARTAALHFAATAQKAGFRVSINSPYDATRSTTIASFIQSQGGDAFEIEIARHLREPDRHPEDAERLVMWLSTCIREV